MPHRRRCTRRPTSRKRCARTGASRRPVPRAPRNRRRPARAWPEPRQTPTTPDSAAPCCERCPAETGGMSTYPERAPGKISSSSRRENPEKAAYRERCDPFSALGTKTARHGAESAERVGERPPRRRRQALQNLARKNHVVPLDLGGGRERRKATKRDLEALQVSRSPHGVDAPFGAVDGLLPFIDDVESHAVSMGQDRKIEARAVLLRKARDEDPWRPLARPGRPLPPASEPRDDRP